VVLVNVDEINTISQVLRSREKAARIVAELARELRSMSMNGVANNCPVVPLVAGTAQLGLQGCGVLPLVLDLPVMTEEDMFKALRSSDVDEQYLNNPDFIRLLGDTGGVPGLVRCVLEGLTVQYDAARIPIARALAQEYINSKMQHIPLRVVRALLPVVLTGQTVFQGSTVAKNHSTTYDHLQVQGSVWLTKVPGAVAEYHAVVPIMTLKSICSQHTTDVEVSRVTHMIDLLGRTDRDGFAEFLGWYHSFMSRTLSRARFLWCPPVTLGELYRGVEMHPELAATQLALRDTTDYKVEPRRAGGEEHSFPPSERLQKGGEAGGLAVAAGISSVEQRRRSGGYIAGRSAGVGPRHPGEGTLRDAHRG
jgi:hypothetical protein